MALARVIPQQTRKPAEWNPKHPFQATANGDDTVNIAPGAVLSWLTNNSGNLHNGPFYGDEQNFLGDDVTVTGSGTIYLVLTTGLTEVAYDSFGGIVTQVYRATAAPTVAFEPTFTGANLYLPVADVSLTDSVASVTRQLLDHNPLLQLHFAYEDTP